MHKRLSVKVANFFKTMISHEKLLTPADYSEHILISENHTIQTDLYLPRHHSDPNQAPTIIVLHGMAPLGNQDPRLIHLANCLANLGYRAVLPHFPTVTSYLFTLESVTEYAKFFNTLKKQSLFCPSGKYAILTFSLSGPVALKASTLMGNQTHISAFLTIGSPHSLKDVFTAALTDPNYDRFTKFVMLKNVLHHSKQAEDALMHALRLRIQMENNACPATTLDNHLETLTPSQQQQYQKILTTLPNTLSYYQEHQATIEALDHRFQQLGDYSEITFPLILIHSKKDSIFSASETKKLSKYLKTLKVKHKKLITTIFDHVTTELSMSKMHQALRMYSAFYYFFLKAGSEKKKVDLIDQTIVT
jgi:predicted alpha/beta-fold hydrolase